MATEYLLVTYPEQRAVLADGSIVGFTNHTLLLPTDEYLISLEGTGYAPPNQDVPLTGTSLEKPMVISFSPTSAAGGAAQAPAAPLRSRRAPRGQEERECLGPRHGSSPASCSRAARHASKTTR